MFKEKVVSSYGSISKDITIHNKHTFKINNTILFKYDKRYKTLDVSIKFINELINSSEYESLDYLSVCEMIQSHIEKDFKIKIEKFHFRYFH